MTGSIPARAGEPASANKRSRPVRVYPRACGGTFDAAAAERRISGLSPRVRGNRAGCVGQPGWAGSIPARAGEPTDGAPGLETGRVYPRACGGTCSWVHSRDRGTGLSPRVRGNRLRVLLGQVLQRSIPARAGEPRRRQTSPPAHAVYPRACGGNRHNRERHGVRISTQGLSPRVRGNRAQSPGHRRMSISRSIPARAGEPERRRDSHGD